MPIVYVGRPSKWGNPFRIVQYSDGKWAVKTDGSDRCNDILIQYGHAVYDTKEAAAKDAVFCHAYWLCPHGDSVMDSINKETEFYEQIKLLKGKNLSCWCKPGDPCHADVLIEIANY